MVIVRRYYFVIIFFLLVITPVSGSIPANAEVDYYKITRIYPTSEPGQYGISILHASVDLSIDIQNNKLVDQTLASTSNPTPSATMTDYSYNISSYDVSDGMQIEWGFDIDDQSYMLNVTSIGSNNATFGTDINHKFVSFFSNNFNQTYLTYLTFQDIDDEFIPMVETILFDVSSNQSSHHQGGDLIPSFGEYYDDYQLIVDSSSTDGNVRYFTYNSSHVSIINTDVDTVMIDWSNNLYVSSSSNSSGFHTITEFDLVTDEYDQWNITQGQIIDDLKTIETGTILDLRYVLGGILVIILLVVIFSIVSRKIK